MRVFVIGGTGFTGPFFLRRLFDLGHELLVLNRGRRASEIPEGSRRIIDERSNLGAHRTELRRFSPDVVVDTILFTENDARRLVEICRGIAGRILAISSQDVYRAYGRVIGREPGPPDETPLHEEAPLRNVLFPYRGTVPVEHPLHTYDKILVERVIMGDPTVPGTVLRFPMVYGPGDAQHRLHGYVKRMDDGRRAIVIPSGLAAWRWTRGYVENMAHAILLVVTDDRAAGRIYNVGEPTALSEQEWICAIGRVVGWPGIVVPVPEDRVPEAMRGEVAHDQDLVTDSTRIREELGYAEVVTREEALRRTVAWERLNPPAGLDPDAFDYASEDDLLRGLGRNSRA